MKGIAAKARRCWKGLLIQNSLVLAVAGLSLATVPISWVGSAKLILPKSNSSLLADLGTLGTYRDGQQAIDPTQISTQVSILTSETLLQRVLENDPEKDDYAKKSRYGKLFKVVADDANSNVITITAKGASPALALYRLDAMNKAYQQRLNELRQDDQETRTRFGQQELQQAENRLNQTQSALTAFKKSSGLVNSDVQVQGVVNNLNSFVSLQAQAQAQAQSNAARVRSLSAQLGMTIEQALNTLKLSENEKFLTVRRQFTDVNAELVKARTLMTDNHPRVQALLAHRNQLQAEFQSYIAQATSANPQLVAGSQTELIMQLVEATNNQIAQEKQVEKLGQQIAEFKTTLNSMPPKQARLQELQHQYELAEGVYKGLIARMQQAKIDAFSLYPNVQVLDPPSVESKSPLLLIALNAVLASILGSAAILFTSERRKPHLVPKDLQSTKIPILACVPENKFGKGEQRFSPESEVVLQQLASSINMLHQGDRLLITSATQGEGKTTVVVGLAQALVDLGFRVLMVDGDFRRAALTRRFGYARGQATSEIPIQIHPNLDLLPTSPKQGNILGLVSQGHFEHNLAAAEATGSYDYVLIDTAPVSLTSETTLMAADSSVLFVVRPNFSERNAVQHSIEQLNRHKVSIMGWVVNGVEPSRGYLSYGAEAQVETITTVEKIG